MKKSCEMVFRISAPIVMLVILISIITAQDNLPQIKQTDSTSPQKLPPPEPLPMSEWAKTIPISNNRITLGISVDNHRPIQVTQLEGGLIRIEKIGEEIYGFAPYFTDQTTKTLAIRVYEISRVSKSGEVIGEAIKQVHTLIAGRIGDGNLTSYADSKSRFVINVIDFQKAPKQEDKSRTTQNYIPVDEANQCCVICDGLLTCGCNVITDCGNCCRGACC